MFNDDDRIIDVEIVEGESLPAVIGAGDASNSEDIELPNRQDALLAGNPERRCVAHRSNGDRCRKFAIYGSTVCRTHGGATKHVQAKARIRIENASNRLMGRLIEFAFDNTKPPEVQLRAIRDALDRGGMKPPSEVVLSQGETKPYEMVFEDIGGTPPDELNGVYTGYGSAGIDSPSTQADPSNSTREPATAGDPPSSFSHPPRGDQGDIASTRENTQSTGAECNADWPDSERRYADSSYTSERSESSHDQRPRRPRRDDADRDTHQQRAGRHITGDDAMRLANMANARNREISALPPLRELESPHRRYPRP